jgi:uncharacterized protein (TIGR03382 family)
MALSLIAGAASAASAGFTENIYLAFSDPVGQREVRYIQPADATQLGAMTYNTQAPINLSFDFSDFGIFTPLELVTNLTMTASIGPASPGSQANEFLATAFGGFEFRRQSDNALMISVSFADASLSMLRTSGGLTANGPIQTAQFTVLFTAALLAEFAGVGYDFAGFDTSRTGDASFTLTAVTPVVNLITPPGSTEQFFGNFASNASFSSTIPVIPTPGAATLVAAAGLVIVGRRRR